MHVKICGITTLSDALATVEAGADMIGYNFYPKSKRYLTPEACSEIQNELARRNVSATTVGVFVNASQAEIEETVALCNIGYTQLSGDETVAFARALKIPWFKAIRPESQEEAARDAERYAYRRLDTHRRADWQSAPKPETHSGLLLVDSFRPGQYGGTGEVGDWTLASALSGHFSILLAGGLTPENVASAIEQVNPWGVDVASGVEFAPGVKDASKIRKFVEQVHKYTG